MTVHWSDAALDSRDAFLDRALASAFARSDPHIYAAALAMDSQLEADAEDLDGLATYRAGPVPDTHIKPAGGGRFVLIYRRDVRDALVLDVLPARSNWQHNPAPAAQ